MRPFRATTGGALVGVLEPAEGGILGLLLDQLEQLLTADADDVGDDPVLERLFPDGHRSDPAMAAEYRDLTEASLRSGKADDLLDARFPTFQSGRGGQVTYHGPGQRVAYVMLDLKGRRPDVRAYVASLEEWIIRTLAAFNVRGERREDRVGVWVKRPDKGPGHEDKIAAIGVRLRRWVSFHGIAINVEPDLSHFQAIVPCGVVDPRYGVTSLVDLGLPVTMADVDIALRQAFSEVFGDTAARLRETAI